MVVKTPNIVFRDYVTDGVPASGANPPSKSDIRDMLNYGFLLNARMYGAAADGSADDTLPVQAVIDDAKAAGKGVFFPKGVYRTTTSLSIDACCALYGEGFPGPRVYSQTPLTSYGGSEIVYNAAPSNRLLAASYALKIIAGAVGSEGYVNTRVRGLGFSWTGLHAGGIYAQGVTNLEINDCHFTGGKTNYDAGTLDGIGIYANDMICSKIRGNVFRHIAYGIVAEQIFNENEITENDFSGISTDGIGGLLPTYFLGAVLLRGKTTLSIRNTIRNNNCIRTHYFVHMSGLVSNITVAENTVESVSHGGIVATTADLLDSTSVSQPRNVHVLRNTLISFGADGNANEAAINLCTDGVSSVKGNALYTPTSNCDELLAFSLSASGRLVISENDQSTKDLANGLLSKITVLDPSELVITSGSDATPSVFGVTTLLYNLSGTLSITDLDDSKAGQIVTVENSSSNNLTVTHGTGTLRLNGASNCVLGQNDSITLMCLEDGGVWEEIGRSNI